MADSAEAQMMQDSTPTSDQSTNSHGQPIGKSMADWSPPSAPEKVVVDGYFCRLEPLNAEAHAKDLFDANALDTEGKNWTYLPYGPFATFDRYREWVRGSSDSDDPQFYAVILKSSRRAAGVASYLRVRPAIGNIEVGHIHLSQRLQRSLAATEALFLMMKRAFELGYRRYEWKCDSLNAASRSAAQRLGLSFEGVFRQAIVYKGRNRDTAWFAAIDSDWPALEQAFTRWLSPDNFDQDGNQRSALSDLTAPLRRSSK